MIIPNGKENIVQYNEGKGLSFYGFVVTGGSVFMTCVSEEGAAVCWRFFVLNWMYLAVFFSRFVFQYADMLSIFAVKTLIH